MITRAGDERNLLSRRALQPPRAESQSTMPLSARIVVKASRRLAFAHVTTRLANTCQAPYPFGSARKAPRDHITLIGRQRTHAFMAHEQPQLRGRLELFDRVGGSNEVAAAHNRTVIG